MLAKKFKGLVANMLLAEEGEGVSDTVLITEHRTPALAALVNRLKAVTEYEVPDRSFTAFDAGAEWQKAEIRKHMLDILGPDALND